MTPAEKNAALKSNLEKVRDQASEKPKEGDVIAVWFSCGAASAVAWALTVEKYGHMCDVRAIYNPVAEEDEDNHRFAEDVSKYIGRDLTVWANPKFPNASAEEVWQKKRGMSFPAGAPCTVHLKKGARQDYEAKHKVDFHVLGFTSEEQKRHDNFTRYERTNVLPILIDAGMSKQACADWLMFRQIKLPRIYSLGYPNANCIGCVKATSPTYWNHVRAVHPEVFERRAKLSRELGVRLVRVKGERIFLDELDPNARGQEMKSLNFDCGIFCEGVAA